MYRTIHLTQDRVRYFVAAAGKCDFDIDIWNNRYVVDAKSILGVFGLDLSKPLTVSYDGYHSEFEALLQEYTVAC